MLDVISVPDLLQQEPKIILVESFADGNISDGELRVIASVVAKLRPTKVFEIGTFDGRTALNIALNTPKDTRIFTLDLPASELDSTALELDFQDRKYVDKPASGARFLGTVVAEKIEQLYSDSAKFDYSPYAGRMDFVFVDGSHSAPYVKSDTEAALKIVSPNGVIMWHDYDSCWPGVTETLNGLSQTDVRCNGLKHIEGTSFAILDCSGALSRN